jgi:hypothetical protein
VTSRGEAVGVLELGLDDEPDQQTLSIDSFPPRPDWLVEAIESMCPLEDRVPVYSACDATRTSSNQLGSCSS